MTIGEHGGNEFIRGPKWRTRTSPPRLARAALVTFALILVPGYLIVIAFQLLLDRLGAPTWLAVLPWLVPMAGAVGWSLVRPTPAVATDDDDDSWPGYAIRYVMVGGDTPRRVPARIAAALLFGAPVGWALGVFGVLTLLGLF